MKIISFSAVVKVAAMCAAAVGVPSVCRAKMPDALFRKVVSVLGAVLVAGAVCAAEVITYEKFGAAVVDDGIKNGVHGYTPKRYVTHYKKKTTF